MKKLFTFMFALLLAAGIYANSETIDLSTIESSLKNMDLFLQPGDFPISNKSHKDNTIEMKVNFTEVYLGNYDKPNIYPVHWSESNEYYDWKEAHPFNYDRATEEQREKYDEAISKFANDYDAKHEGDPEKNKENLKIRFNNTIKNHSKSAQTECKMVRISSYWLVGAASCLPSYVRENPSINSNEKEDIAFDLYINSDKIYYFIYFIDSIDIDGVNVNPVENMFIGNGLVLIHLSAAQVNKMENLSAHQANILVPLPSILVYPIRAYVDGKPVKNFRTNGTKITSTKASAGTPIFIENGNYREVLLGFNSAPYENLTSGISRKFNSKRGEEYQFITSKMKEFIIKTISSVTPNELQEIKELK